LNKSKRNAILNVILAMIVFIVVRFVLSELIWQILVKMVSEQVNEDIMYVLYTIASLLTTILIAVPILYLVINKKQDFKKVTLKPVIRMPAGQFLLRFLLAAFPVMLICTIQGIGILLHKLDSNTMFPLELYEIALIILTSVIVMPIVEEYISRGLILNKLKCLNIGAAIALNTILFTIGHGNIVNMIIAIVPGVIFAHTALKYGGVLYTMIMHALLNFSGSIAIPFLFQTGNKMLIGTVSVLLCIFMLAALSLTVFFHKKIFHIKTVM